MSILLLSVGNRIPSSGPPGSFFNPEFWLNDMFADDFWGM